MTELERPKRVLVSGAAGGVGTAVAKRFAADGAGVALTDINKESLERVATEVGGHAFVADGTKREALAEVVASARDALGGLDAVIAAQGANIPSTLSARGQDAWTASLDVNLNGAFHLTAEAMPHLVESGGSVVMISSSAGILAGPPGTVGYTAAKTGLIGLVRWLAREYGPKGVRVNAVCPGWVRTPFGDGGMAYLAQRDGVTVEEAYARATQHVPLRRAAVPDEIAGVCAFLASSDAAMVTGHTLVADGGAAIVDPSTSIFDIS